MILPCRQGEGLILCFFFLFRVLFFGSIALCRFTLGFDVMTCSAACRADSIDAVSNTFYRMLILLPSEQSLLPIDVGELGGALLGLCTSAL